jgi:hypothetical protein
LSDAGDFEWDKFEAAVQFLKKGIDTLFFRDVIKAATGKDVLPFNKESLLVIDSVDTWIKNNFSTLSNTVYSGFIGRANELGNKVEDELRNGLNQIPNLRCDKPLLSSGKKQATGYPDCLIDSDGIKIYADIKTYQTKTADSSLRSFFYQPTNKSKIHFDAPHCIIGFETESVGGDNKSPFRLINYKIIDVYNLKVNFKAEFNAGNLEIYSLNKPL